MSQALRTEEAQELEPTDLLIWAEARLVRLVSEVPQVVELKQVNHRDVDQLLGAERFLENQSLQRTHTHKEQEVRMYACDWWVNINTLK